MRIHGSNALITGGSRGLGAALGRELARRGGRVVLAARGALAAESVAASIRAEGGFAQALQADVSDERSVYPLVGSAAALAGPIDILVHNASSLGPVPLCPLVDTEGRDFASVLEANLLGPFRLTKAVLGSMILRRRGLIIGITSDAGVVGYPTWGAYGVSKAALDHLLRTWAAELADSGVSFLTIDPGEMDTQMHADAIPDADRTTLADPADVAAWIADLIDEGTYESGSRVSAPQKEMA